MLDAFNPSTKEENGSGSLWVNDIPVYIMISRSTKFYIVRSCNKNTKKEFIHLKVVTFQLFHFNVFDKTEQ